MTQPTLTTYGGRLREIGYAGGLVDENTAIIETRVNGAAGAIDFGLAVARLNDKECKVIAADGDDIVGISVRHAIRSANSSGVVNYVQYDAVPVLRSGYIYVTALENAVPGDAVISVTAQGGQLGSTTGGAAGAGRVVVPNATWETTTTAGEIGIVRIYG